MEVTKYYDEHYALAALPNLPDSPYQEASRSTMSNVKKRILSKADSFLTEMAFECRLDKLGQMWTNLDKVGQNCVDFGERMCYDINVPRKAQGLFSKNAEQLF